MTNHFHVVELNKLGDHVTIKCLPTLAKARAFRKMMEQFAYEGEEYYISDIRKEYTFEDESW